MNSHFINENTVKILMDLSTSSGSSLFLELVDLFEEETPKRIEEIKDAAKDQDCKKLTMAAHTLKSGSAYLGATKLAEISKSLEHAAAEGHIPSDIDDIVNQLLFYYSKANEYFENKKVA